MCITETCLLLFKPVVACIHGKCIGAGVDIVTACDIRFVPYRAVCRFGEFVNIYSCSLCSEDATFSVAEVKVGIVAGWCSFTSFCCYAYLHELW
jgi:enoyl-CoA hydratase/carnithine racemase